MIFEEAIGSLADLEKEVKLIDYDGGIRLMVKYRGTKAYAFITRGLDGGYLLNVYDYRLEGNFPTPNQLMLFMAFNSAHALMEFIKNYIDEPFTCFKY